MDQAAVDHRRTQAMEQTSLEGNQSEGRTTVERTYDAENKAENIPNYQTDADIRTILEQQRQAGETDDDEIERRNERAENRDRKISNYKPRPKTGSRRAKMFDLYVGEIEDESHFVVDCAFYDDSREFKNVLMKEGIEFGEERKTETGKKRLMQLRRRQPSCAKKL